MKIRRDNVNNIVKQDHRNVKHRIIIDTRLKEFKSAERAQTYILFAMTLKTVNYK